jgi:hypothetical protein
MALLIRSQAKFCAENKHLIDPPSLVLETHRHAFLTAIAEADLIIMGGYSLDLYLKTVYGKGIYDEGSHPDIDLYGTRTRLEKFKKVLRKILSTGTDTVPDVSASTTATQLDISLDISDFRHMTLSLNGVKVIDITPLSEEVFNDIETVPYTLREKGKEIDTASASSTDPSATKTLTIRLLHPSYTISDYFSIARRINDGANHHSYMKAVRRLSLIASIIKRGKSRIHSEGKEKEDVTPSPGPKVLSTDRLILDKKRLFDRRDVVTYKLNRWNVRLPKHDKKSDFVSLPSKSHVLVLVGDRALHRYGYDHDEKGALIESSHPSDLFEFAVFEDFESVVDSFVEAGFVAEGMTREVIFGVRPSYMSLYKEPEVKTSHTVTSYVRLYDCTSMKVGTFDQCPVAGLLDLAIISRSISPLILNTISHYGISSMPFLFGDTLRGREINPFVINGLAWDLGMNPYDFLSVEEFVMEAVRKRSGMKSR